MNQAQFEAREVAPYNDFTMTYRWTVSDPISLKTKNSYQKTFTVTFKHGCSQDALALTADINSLIFKLGDPD